MSQIVTPRNEEVMPRRFQLLKFGLSKVPSQTYTNALLQLSNAYWATTTTTKINKHTKFLFMFAKSKHTSNSLLFAELEKSVIEQLV